MELDKNLLTNQKTLWIQKYTQLLLQTKQLIRSRNKLEFADNRSRSKWFADWSSLAEDRSDIVNKEYVFMMKIGLESLGVDDTTTPKELARLSDEVKEVRKEVEELASALVRTQFGLKKKEVIRYLSAVVCGLDQHDYYKEELSK